MKRQNFLTQDFITSECVKDGEVLDSEWDSYHLDDTLASHYQSIDWAQQTTCKIVSQLGEPFWPLEP